MQGKFMALSLDITRKKRKFAAEKNDLFSGGTNMDKIRYINMCIVEFGKKFGMPASISYNYLKEHKALNFLDECYAAEHTLSLDDALDDIQTISRRHGGTI